MVLNDARSFQPLAFWSKVAETPDGLHWPKQYSIIPTKEHKDDYAVWTAESGSFRMHVRQLMVDHLKKLADVLRHRAGCA